MTKPSLIFVGSRDKMDYLAIAADLNGYDILGILDSHYYDRVDCINDLPVIGDERWLLDPSHAQAQHWLENCVFFPANYWSGNQSGANKLDLQALRQDRIKILEKSSAKVISLLSPGSYQEILKSKYCNLSIGKGVFIGSGVHISAHNVKIGDYSVVLDRVDILANTKIKTNVCICVGSYLYDCEIGDDSYFGMGARIRIDPRSWAQNNPIKSKIYIGKNATVWATALVDKHVPDDSMFTHHGRIFKKNLNKS